MCGIVGIVHREKARPVPSDVIERMCTVLTHRGPDDHGVHVADGVGLGMRRLSIIDLPGGQQPVYTEDRSRILVFNGEIYNYRDLRPELLARGHSAEDIRKIMGENALRVLREAERVAAVTSR